VIELLRATLGARGHVLQDFYQAAFMKEINGIGGDASSYVTRERLSEMLDNSGACVDVEIIFDTTGLNDDDDLIAFEEFLRVFRGVRTRLIRERLNTGITSTTAAASAGKVVIENDAGTPNIYDRFEIVDRLGGVDDIVFQVAERPTPGTERHSRIASVHESHYALKIFRLNRFDEPLAQKISVQLMQDLQLAKNLNHSGIARVHDVSKHINHIHVVLDLCNGGSLADGFPFTESQVARIITEILAALVYLRGENGTHGSICLENVLFETKDENSPVKLTGFGFDRKYLGERQEDEVGSELPKTYAWAPESLKENIFNHKADMWSLGVIAYAMLAGHLPFGERYVIRREHICVKLSQLTHCLDIGTS
jgi:serine/threonine protein kinase